MAIASFRLAQAALASGGANGKRFADMALETPLGLLRSHNSHPDFAHLILLVFEAVLEVVCVSFPGYVVARRGMFDADAQKMVANLNVQLFTPCLVFTKLASQLNADKLVDLAVIPVIFCAQTLISWLCATLVSKAFKFPKRQTNFVIAMGVFGNSNSLPISLVISLSKTLKGLHWDRVPGDNDNEVAARGILYLLIFQQLGQLVRWTWGYNVLLAPEAAPDSLEDGGQEQDEDHPDSLIDEGRYVDDEEAALAAKKPTTSSDYGSGSGSQTPQTVSSVASSDADDTQHGQDVLPTPTNGNAVAKGPGNLAGNLGPRYRSTGHITQFPSYSHLAGADSSNKPSGVAGVYADARGSLARAMRRVANTTRTFFANLFRRFPPSVQKGLSLFGHYSCRFAVGVWEFMNPPLWAMVAALIVASVPQLQTAFFQPGSFVSNSVTRAISQSGSVAVPLILVVLGANLARNTLPQSEQVVTPEAKREERNLLIAALVSRMLLPTLIMAPFLAIFAKFVPVSILDDPIFIIVCFLLTGAPSALQLAQICQLNNVFMGAMSRLLFQSYVVWILPSTLILVMLALEVVEWAQ
ncbi:hypothetical protein MBLNU459_g0435t1 [Dothideomycetes sp. NU459]